MKSGQIKYILFDAANTLIHKPLIWVKMLQALEGHGISVDKRTLQVNHKLLSEVIEFPDKTSESFYNKFNTELLLSLGVLPSEKLLFDIFNSCTYLPWEKFEDTAVLAGIQVPIGVLSNFNSGLNAILNNLFGDIFRHIIVSEEKQVRKPDTAFFQLANEVIGLPPEEILYVGDSFKLDIIPGLKMGWNVMLIDRMEMFAGSEITIPSLSKLQDLL